MSTQELEPQESPTAAVPSAAQPSKTALLLRLLKENPGEFWERVGAIADVQADRLRRRASWTPVSPAAVQERLRSVLGDLAPFLQESPLRQLEGEVSRRQQQLGASSSLESYHDADFALARFCYAVCRLRRPEVVVETGVARGVSSAFLLQALEVNGKGELWSIDLPPLREVLNHRSGCLVPDRLGGRWHRLRGPSRRLLSQLVSQLAAIDVFLHDSLHTWRNMGREFRTAWSKLRPGGVLIADDVERNRFFETFARRPDVGLAAAAGEESKAAVFGVMVKAAPEHHRFPRF